jgi:DNA-binding response OmpR family regulator
MSPKHKILIVEDDTDMVESIRQFLGARGYETMAAYDTDEGYQKLLQEGADMIILDAMFGSEGKTKGFDFARRLRGDKQHSGIPVLMLTAVNEKKPGFGFSAKSDGAYLPVDAFLDKPFKPDELYAIVEELLSQKVSKWHN